VIRPSLLKAGRRIREELAPWQAFVFIANNLITLVESHLGMAVPDELSLYCTLACCRLASMRQVLLNTRSRLRIVDRRCLGAELALPMSWSAPYHCCQVHLFCPRHLDCCCRYYCCRPLLQFPLLRVRFNVRAVCQFEATYYLLRFVRISRGLTITSGAVRRHLHFQRSRDTFTPNSDSSDSSICSSSRQQQ
jgi:hypothetical protein